MMNTVMSNFGRAPARGPRHSHASALSATVRAPAGTRTIGASGFDWTSGRATRRNMSYTRPTYASRPRCARGLSPTTLFRIR